MSDERTGRELTPRPDTEPGAVTPREALPAPTTAPADRFYAGDQAHTVGLTEERAGQVVRQSSNARMVAFLGSLFLVLFVPLYWLYDIGIPVLGVDGRLAAEEETQYVTSVARGHALYLANCARCHGDQGQGGIGPPLNDQMKLYNTITEAGLPGPGHLNPNYLQTVLEEGGRYICGDPNSLMPAWQQPEGPLNYREVEEIIAFMLASEDVSWEELHVVHEVGATPEPAEEFHGWRDPDFTPPPDATPVPECWRGTPAPGTTSSPEPIANPGTPDDPRVIEVLGTEQLTWVDPATGDVISSITVVDGETIEFRISNESAAVPHSFYLGSADVLATAPPVADLPGVGQFTSEAGTQSFTYTVDELPEQPQFACTVPGHYQPMHGPLVLVNQPNAPGSPGTGESPAASPSPGQSPSPGGESPPPSPGASP